MSITIPNHLPVNFRSCGALLRSTGDETQKSGVVETDEYVEFQFRILSRVLIPGHWFDFTEGDVLKKAAPLFKGARIIVNHYPSVDNVFGVVMESHWEDESKERAAGINGTYRIFKKFGEDIIDKLQSDPPLLDATSAGIRLDYERSHPSLKDWQHYFSLGKKIDGEVVRYIVKEVTDVLEVSIVFRGADKNAKRLSNGEKDFDYYSRILEKRASKNFSHKEERNLEFTKEQIRAAKLSESDLRILGLNSEGGELSQMQFDSLMSRLALKEKEIETFRELEKRNEPLIRFGLEHEKSVRAEAQKFYRAFSQDKQDDKILNFLETGELEMVKRFGEDYKARLEERHPVNGESRQSSKTNEPVEQTYSDSEIENYREA